MGQVRMRLGVVVAMLTVALATLFGPGAGVASEVDVTGLTIFAHLCPSDADLPEETYEACDHGASIAFSVAASGGSSLGSCTTAIGTWRDSEAAFCSITDIPYGSSLVVTADASTVPAGYSLLDNPQSITIEEPELEGQDAVPTIMFYAVEDAEQEPPAEEPDGDTSEPEGDSDGVEALPSTGTGSSAGSSTGAMAALTTVAMICLVVGMRLRNEDLN